MLYYTAMEKTAPGLSFSIAKSLQEIPPEEWDSLFGKELIESYGYQKTLEDGGTEELSFGYLVGKRDGRAVLILPFFIMDFSLAALAPEFLRRIAGIFDRHLRKRILFLGSPTTEGFSMGLAPTEDSELILDKTVEELRVFSKSEKISGMAFYNLSLKDLKLAEYLKRKKFLKLETLPTTAIEIKSGSLEEYIRGLGKNTRKDLKKKLRLSQELVRLKTEERLDVTDIIDDVYRLYMNNVNDADVHFETLTRKFFLDICRNMPGVAKYFITYDKEKIVAFNLCLVKNKDFIDKFIGFDYNVARKYSLYYTTFCHNIDWCVKNGIKIYQPGFSDYHPKMRLGAKLIPLDIYAQAFNPLLGLTLRILRPWIEPKNLDPVPKSS